MSEPRVIYATVRETISDDISIECRFDDGQKFSAVEVAAGYEELAQRIAAFLSYGHSRDALFRAWLRRILGGLPISEGVIDRLVTQIGDEVLSTPERRHYGEER